MTRTLLACAGIVAVAGLGSRARADGGQSVAVTTHEADRRVDVTVGGTPFTSYIWPTTIKKPVLYPIRTAHGTIVTRGFPLDPRPGERVDHPHHVGLWFNYGDVAGYDFWNNSDAIEPERRPHMGTIYQRAVTVATGGPVQGVLEVNADWVIPDGTILLKEHTAFVFSGTADTRTIDRITTLTAGDKAVPLPDNKEGVFGMRVTRALEIPSNKPEVFTDASGRPTTVARLDNTGVNGNYLTSEGETGDVWGTRGRWCVLSGKVDGAPVAIAILDHPSNPGYPTYWHARGYGLFAANPLGQKELSLGKRVLNFSIPAGGHATFRYRVLIIDGNPTAAQTEAAWKAWSETK